MDHPRECDLVMKGGITSGVVYPLAAVELAKEYRFRSIGGASAGAIAAALTAAAELGRRRGADGFPRLEREALELGAKLRSFFQPSPPLAPLFRILLAVVSAKGVAGRIVTALVAVAREYAARTIGAALVAAALAIAALLFGSPGVALAILVALLVALPILWLRRCWIDLTRVLPDSGFGLCPGPTQPGYVTPGLVDWLDGMLDELAAQPADAGRPITFGDLEPEGIELRAMTTCLSHGRPYVLPFDNRLFSFRISELERLFPPRVIDWMTSDEVQARAKAGPESLRRDAAARVDDEAEAETEEAVEPVDAPGEPHSGEPYFHVPLAADLPVVVAVRMSLSFPLLFEAVPLHACDFTRLDPLARRELRKVWFTDGGVCHNFPIHLFDAMWPTRPTFGITLEPFQPESHATRVFLPSHARHGILRAFRDVESLPGFLGSIVGTMQEWQDNLQSTLPGYRERIAHVALDEDEGGLNLDMDATVIDKLVEYGRKVGGRLRADFDWPAHRWTRHLQAMLRLDAALVAKGVDVDALVAGRAPNTRPYGQSATWHAAAGALLGAWSAAADTEEAAQVRATARVPHPVPAMRIVPRE
jgi:predicted acylesterase/phospholipase RssA